MRTVTEILVCDYTRKGFIDGLAARVPTVAVRPGKPNKGGAARWPAAAQPVSAPLGFRPLSAWIIQRPATASVLASVPWNSHLTT